jgi:hypothetical protein
MIRITEDQFTRNEPGHATTFVVTLPDGNTAQRTSLTRKYSHCVIHRLSFDEALRIASDEYVREDTNNFEFFTRVVAAGVGSDYYAGRDGRHRSFRVDEAMHSRAARLLAANPDCETYIATRRAERTQAVRRMEADGYYNEWHVAGWQSRLDLANDVARNLRSRPYFRDVLICEVAPKSRW